jgi:hypothetical protein
LPAVTRDQLATVYRLLYESGLFMPRPPAAKDGVAPVGGDKEWMTVTAANATYDVPISCRPGRRRRPTGSTGP